MAPSFRDAAELRLWQPAIGFHLDRHAPFFGEEAWGRRLPAGTDGLPAEVRAYLRVVPEGLALHASCRRCGGRHDAVLDFRSLDESCFGIPAPPADFEGFGIERAQYVEFVLLQQALRTWADGHLRCRPAPEQACPPQLEPAVSDVVRLMAALAKEDVRRGKAPEAVIAAVPEQGAAIWLDLDGEDEAARALTAFRVREITDENPARHYVLVASEQDPGSGSEADWRLAVLAPDAAWAASARVLRQGDPCGPGRLSAPRWSAAGVGADWLDGLRAPRIFFPMTRPARPE